MCEIYWYDGDARRAAGFMANVGTGQHSALLGMVRARDTRMIGDSARTSVQFSQHPASDAFVIADVWFLESVRGACRLCLNLDCLAIFFLTSYKDQRHGALATGCERPSAAIEADEKRPEQKQQIFMAAAMHSSGAIKISAREPSLRNSIAA